MKKSDETGHSAQPLSRRGFLSTAAWAGLLAAGSSVLGQSLRFLRPAVTHESATVFAIGLPDEYPPGSRRLLQRERVLILRDENGFRAISAVCTHLGCTVNLVDWGFSCPCHGSKFDWNGTNFAGPAPRPLAWHALSLAPDGQLVVDTRSGHTVPPGQFFNPPT